MFKKSLKNLSFIFKKKTNILKSYHNISFNQSTILKMLSYSKWNNFKEEDESLLFDSNAINKIEAHLKVDQLQSTYELVKDKSIVLIGEGSHGTKEYYQLRCDITKKLIENKKCQGVCIEGDFPSVGLLHLYVTQLSQSITLEEALLSFQRFPVWMV
jgi:erythromycin esterase-like protein